MLSKILLALIFSLTAVASAEEITLKSGEKIEVNIIAKSSSGVRVDYKGATLVYYPFEIASIDGEPLILEEPLQEKKPAGKGQGEAIAVQNIGIKEYLDRGKVLNDKGNFDLAVSDFNKALEIDKNFAPAYLSRGIAYANKKDTEKAFADYNKAIELDPKNAQAYYIRGLTFLQKKDPDQAIADFSQAVSIDPQFVQAYLQMALLKISKDDFVSAISDMDKVIKLNGEVPSAYYLRGIAYANKGNVEQAIANYNNAIILNPKYAEAYINRGLAYLYKANLDLAQGPNDSPKNFININSGVTISNKEDLDKALSDCSKAIELNPKYPEGYTARIRVFIARQEYGKARADVKQLEELGVTPDPQLVNQIKGEL